MKSTESTDIGSTGEPRRQVSVATLVIGAIVLGALIRGMSAMMTSFLVWPLFGVVATAFYGTPAFVFAASLELLLTSVAIIAGMVVGFKARRDPELWWRGVQRVGRFLMIDVGIYLLSVLVAVAVYAQSVGAVRLWMLLAYIVAGNAALFWLGLRIARAGRALKPPPPDED